MTAAIGNDVVFVPVLPSFDSFFTDLSKGAKKGGERAGKDMAGAMEKELRSAEKLVDRTAATQERAQNRAADAADKTRLAQIKLSEALDDSSVSSSKLADLTAKYEKAARDQTTADKAAKRAVDAHEKAQNDLRKATNESEDAVSQSAAGLEDYEGALDKATGGVKNFLGAAAGFAGIAGIGATIASGMDISGAVSAMNRQLGLTGDAATALGDEVSEVMRGGVSASVEDATGAIGALHSQFGYLGSEGEQTAAELSDNFLAFSKTFEVDLAESTQVAGQLIKNNLAPDVETAADLMTVAMQRVPQAMRGEMVDAINEYGVNFSNLGYSGEEAFSLLVGAAEGGQYAIDKTGDAIKEFSVLAIDPAKAEVFESLGINAEKAASNVAVGGDVARETLEETARALLDIEDPGARAAAAVELFGAPIEDLGVDQIPGFLENLSGMEDGMGDVTGSSQELADQMANSLPGRLNALKGTVQSLAGDAFMFLWDVVQNQVIPAFQDTIGWIQDNQAWLGPLAATIGGAAAAWGLWVGAIKTWQAVTKIAAGVQAAFNGVMAANPIMLVVIAIGALVAGLVWFFTQTELGQELWGKFTTALSDGWDWVVEKLSAGWEWLRENVFDPLWTFVSETVWPALQTAFEFISDAWTALGDGVAWAYDNLIKPTFDFLVTAGKVLFAVLTTVVFTPLKLAWDVMSAGIAWAWENLIKPAWDAISSFATETLWPILDSVFGFIGDAWSALSDGIQWYYENVIKRVWSALSSALTWMYENVVQPVLGWIGDRWDDMADVLHAGWRWIDENVFAGLKRGLEIVQDAFGLARDAIGRAWDGIKEKAAAPVKFVIDTVFNDGIVEVWNKVAGWVGLDPIDRYEPAWLGQYYTGGVVNQVPGYSPGRDDHVFVEPRTGTAIALSGGEPILRPEAGRVLGTSWVDGINAAARVGGTDGVEKFLGSYNTGGVVPSIVGLVNRFFPGMTITSTYRDTNDHHGAGLAVDFSNGTDSTPQMRTATKFFHDNYGPALLELIHSPSPFNVKNGQNVGDGFGFYGSGTMNQHRNHVHVAAASPLPEPGDPITPVPSGGVSGGGGVVNWLRNRVADALDSVFTPIANEIPDLGGLIGGLPRAAFEKMTGAVSNFIRGKADESGAYHGDVGAGVEQWRGLVVDILDDKGFSTNLADTVLRRMDQESGGNSRAINNWDSNAAAGTPSKGLMQVIDPTFATHQDPGFGDIWDPEANVRASMNYAMSRYGSLPAAYNRPGGYHAGGLAPAGEGWLHKTALEPEFVLSPDMTQAFIDWMRGTPHGESAAVVAKELASAFAGEDWGYGELASYIGADLAESTIELVQAIGRADRGFRQWAAADEERGRMGTPQEWAMHFGADAAATVGDDLLGLVGLGGIIGSTPNESLLDLLQVGAENLNDVYGLGLPVLSGEELQPMAVIDDEGRVIGTVIEEAEVEAVTAESVEVADTVDTAVATATESADAATSAASTSPSTAASGDRQVVLQIEGDAVSADTIQKAMERLSEELGDVTIRVEKLEGQMVASVVAGAAAGIV